MPPFRDTNRLFYDPVNPVMLPEDDIMQLSPQELQAATDQLDQNLVHLLQRVEENFARCNQIVTERILPAVEQHGENSARIFESIKFWRPFFETAASIRLDQPYADDATSVDASEEEPSQFTASPNQTISDDGDLTYGAHAPSVGGTPRASLAPGFAGEASTSGIPSEPQWSNDMSPFQALQDDLKGAGDVGGDFSAVKAALPDVQRLRLRDLPPDSPDVPEPHFETVNVGNVLSSSAESPSQGKGKGRAVGQSFDLSSAGPSEPSFTTAFQHQSPARAARAGGDKAHSALLKKILHKNMASPARPPLHHGPGSSTPGPGTAKKLQFPPDVPKNWDGIANLSQTSLDAFPSPIKRRTSTASSMADGSFAHPPSSIRSYGGSYISSPARPPRLDSSLNASTSTLRRQPISSSATAPSSLAFSRTPAKEAARRTAQNVYNALDPFDLLDSPMLEPPSALKNPATAVYRFNPAAPPRREPDSPSERGTVQRPASTLGREGRSTVSAGRAGIGGNFSRAYGDESCGSLPAQPSFANASHTQALDLAAIGVPGALPPADASTSLADFGGGTTANIDELLAGHTMNFNLHGQAVEDYAGIVNDDDEDELPMQDGASFTDTGSAGQVGGGGAGGGRAMDNTFTATQQGYDHYAPVHGEKDDEDEEEFRRARGLRLPGQDGPEDTLFGMPTAKGGQGQAAAKRGVSFGMMGARETEDQEGYEEEDSFAEEARRSGFRLHGLSEMETLHGGELLSSEPFQASPLAGRN
ncbi:hypothetical protein JCM11641_001337 [Rhodosporidiobolus odoratus]